MVAGGGSAPEGASRGRGEGDRDGWSALGRGGRGDPPAGGRVAGEVAVLVVLVLVLYQIIGSSVLLLVAAMVLVTLLAYGVLRVTLRILTRTGFARRWGDDEDR